MAYLSGVITFNEILDVIERAVGTIDELEDGHEANVDFFRWVVTVVFFSPQFGIHLQFHFFEINVAFDGTDVLLCNCVVAVTAPILPIYNSHNACCKSTFKESVDTI